MREERKKTLKGPSRTTGFLAGIHIGQRPAEIDRQEDEKKLLPYLLQTYMGGFLKWWVSPTTMGFPTKNALGGGDCGYHHLRKHPYIYIHTPSSNTFFLTEAMYKTYTPVNLRRVIAMENGPFEDVFPIENGDIPASYVSLPKGIKNSRWNSRSLFSFMATETFRSRFLRWRPKHHKFPRLPRSVAV